MEKYDYDAIVIGAGVGGISCASLLAKRGLKTIIFENHNIIGGCCSTFEDHGYHFDTGASIVEFIHIYDSIFERLGRKREDYIDLRSCDPLYSFRTTDGEYIEIKPDIYKTYEDINQYSKKDAKNWLKYCDYWKDMVDGGMEKFMMTEMQSFKSMGKMFDLGFLKFMPAFMTTYEIMIKKWFSHQKTLDTYGFQCYWMGLPPRLCPGLYASINYMEHSGIYYPMGGMISIPQALLNIGKEYGLELKLNSRVKKVIVKNGKARGVELADGTKFSSKIVISNMNAIPLYLDLIGEEHLPKSVIKGIKSYKLSMPSPIIYLGIKGDVPLKAHHSFQLGRFQQMNEVWDEGFMKGRFYDEPITMVCWPSETDPSLAPPGHHAMHFMSMGPYKLAGGDWDSRRDEFTDRVLDHVDKTLWPGIYDQITYKNLSTPLDFEKRLLQPHGAIYGIQNDIASTMVFRPSNRSKSIEGLYLVGASTHPGGGVPMVAASGGITADLVMQDINRL